MKPEDLKRQNDDDLRAVLATTQGRRFLWRMLSQAGLYSPSFATDPLATAYNEGRRSVAMGLMLEAQRVSAPLYVRAVREQMDQLEADAHAVTEPVDNDE